MHFAINGFITQYGYLAILIGCIAEGETFTLLGGIAAHERLLDFSGVLLAAVAGGVIGDQLLYAIGRRYGTRILRRLRRHNDKIVRANRLIRRHPSLFVIGARFMYGFRIIGPIIIGASRLRPWKFFLLNLTGAIIWATLFVTLGYFAGEAIAPWLYKINLHFKQLLWIAAAVIFALVLRFIIRRWNQKRSN